LVKRQPKALSEPKVSAKNAKKKKRTKKKKVTKSTKSTKSTKNNEEAESTPVKKRSGNGFYNSEEYIPSDDSSSLEEETDLEEKIVHKRVKRGNSSASKEDLLIDLQEGKEVYGNKQLHALEGRVRNNEKVLQKTIRML